MVIAAPGNADGGCSFKLTSPSGDVLAHDEYVDYISQPDYVDLDGDGAAELIVVAGAHGSGGYADSFVISQTPQPRVIRVINEACPFRVMNGPEGKAVVTCELNFRFFDGLCNACSPQPAVYLGVENGLLRDHSARFVSEYDAHIAVLRGMLKEADVRAFLKSRSIDAPAYVQSKARPLVLSIVIDYLYSGREAQAREALQTMWPEWDRERVLADVINTRSIGVLGRLH